MHTHEESSTRYPRESHVSAEAKTVGAGGSSSTSAVPNATRALTASCTTVSVITSCADEKRATRTMCTAKSAAATSVIQSPPLMASERSSPRATSPTPTMASRAAATLLPPGRCLVTTQLMNGVMTQ